MGGLDIAELIHVSLDLNKSQAILFCIVLRCAEVEFEDEEEDVEEVEVDQTPKRSVHGRQATASVPKSKVRASPQVQRQGSWEVSFVFPMLEISIF